MYTAGDLFICFVVSNTVKSEGIVLGKRPYNDFISTVDLFTANRGKIRLLVYNKILRSCAVEPGNIVDLVWTEKNDNMPKVQEIDLIKSMFLIAFESHRRLAALNSAISLVYGLLAEGENSEGLYDSLRTLLLMLCSNDPLWQYHYLKFELDFMCCMGFGLNLMSCAVTNSRDNLIYISPKTGHAVSREAGSAYSRLLFAFPDVLRSTRRTENPNDKDFFEGLSLVGYFIDKWLCCKEYNRSMPSSRLVFADMYKDTVRH